MSNIVNCFLSLVFSAIVILFSGSDCVAQPFPERDGAGSSVPKPESEESEDGPFGVKSIISSTISAQSGLPIDKFDGSVDLLNVMDPARDCDRGDWKWDSNNLVLLPSKSGGRLAIPFHAIGSYEVKFNYLSDGPTEFRLAFPVGEHGRAALVVGTLDGKGAGLEGYQGKSVTDAENVHVKREFISPVGKEHHVWVRVEFKKNDTCRVSAGIDKTRVFDLTGNRQDFQLPSVNDHHLLHDVAMLSAEAEREIRFTKVYVHKLEGHSMLTRRLNVDSSESSSERFGLKFDGKTNQTLCRSFYFDGSEPLTFEAWTIPWNKNNGTLFSACAQGKSGWFRLRTENGRWAFLLFDRRANWTRSVVSNEEIRWGELTHVAAIYHMDQLELFIDGRSVGKSRRYNSDTTVPVGYLFRLGNDLYSGGGHYYHGVIDQFRVTRGVKYRSSFKPEPKLTREEGTLVLYDLDEGRGQIMLDKSGNDFHSIGQKLDWVRVTE